MIVQQDFSYSSLYHKGEYKGHIQGGLYTLQIIYLVELKTQAVLNPPPKLSLSHAVSSSPIPDAPVCDRPSD